jgi:ParB-like nuclease domain
MLAYSKLEHLPPGSLIPWATNARTHSRKQIRQIADSIKRFGFTNPILIDRDNAILAGHGRVEAAKLLGMESVPCLRHEHMTHQEKCAYVLADNKLAMNAGWDDEILAGELKFLIEEISVSTSASPDSRFPRSTLLSMDCRWKNPGRRRTTPWRQMLLPPAASRAICGGSDLIA